VGAFITVISVTFYENVTYLRAMRGFMAFYGRVLPDISADWAGAGSNTVKMRLLAGHACIIAVRQITAEVPAPARTRNDISQATASATWRGGRDGDAASRSMAVTAGGDGMTGGGSACAGAGGSGGETGRDSGTGFHMVSQRAQRTDRPGFIRPSGTSYLAAQPGQAICMKIRYDAARTIDGMPAHVANEFCRSKRNGGNRRSLVDSAHAEIRSGWSALRT
jgi:hypothetical protein